MHPTRKVPVKRSLLAALASLLIAAPAALALPVFTASSTVYPDTRVGLVADLQCSTNACATRSYQWHRGDGTLIAQGTDRRSYVAPAGYFAPGCHTATATVRYRQGRYTIVTQRATTTFCL